MKGTDVACASQFAQDKTSFFIHRFRMQAIALFFFFKETCRKPTALLHLSITTLLHISRTFFFNKVIYLAKGVGGAINYFMFFFFQTSLSVSNFAAVIKREMMASISANQEFWQAGVSCGGEGLSAAQQMREGGSGEGGGCYLLWTLL